MKLTYKTLPPGDGDGDIEVQGSDTEFSESGGKPDFDAPCKVQWDEDCPWSEWYSAEDPVKGKPSFVIDWSFFLCSLSSLHASAPRLMTHKD